MKYIWFSFLVAVVVSTSISDQQIALQRFTSSIPNCKPPNIAENTQGSDCSYFYAKWDSDGNVVELYAANLGLTKIPSEIGNLIHLTSFHFTHFFCLMIVF